MADKYQTQCPHCGVKFQITAQQLQLANGTVRCGSCLQVFQANKNLVPLGAAMPPAGVGSARAAPTARPSAAPAATPPAAAPARPAAPASQPVPPAVPPASRTPTAADDDLADMILRELEEAPPAKPAATRPAAPRPPAPPATPPPAAAPQWGAPPPPARPKAPDWGAPPPPKPAATNRDEPQWSAPPPPKAPAIDDDADSSAKRYGIEENKTRISIGGGELDDSVLEGDDPFGVSGSKLLEDHELGADSADESWAKALLGEAPVDERDERVRKFSISADQLSIADNTGVQPLSGLAARLNQMEGRGGAEAAPSGPQNRTGSPRTAADDDLDFLNEPGLTMQDVELPGLDAEEALLPRGEAHEVAWGRDVLWATLSVVFLLVFLGQYLAFNFRELSHDSTWRGIYSVACGALGCQLPGESDVSRVEGANLVIRSHPSAGQALVMDAVIYNRAGFEQPFPRIELGFSDARGNAVAGRVFSPDEYLKGELAGAESMPLDTPIHLTLELVDPGAQAVNYSLRFLPPDAS